MCWCSPWGAVTAAAQTPAETAPADIPPPGAPRFAGSLRYLVQAVEVRGNRKTDEHLILRELGIQLRQRS